MPKGFTDVVKRASETFTDLQKESLLKGKNLATIANIAKTSKISRNNFYAKKSHAWVQLVKNINDFAIEFDNLTKGKYKNPQVEIHKKSLKDCEKKYISMAQQNYELLEKIQDMERIIFEREQTISLLEKRFASKNVNKG